MILIMKKTLTICVAILAMTGCKWDPLEYEKTQGKTGQLQWMLSKKGTLTISGKGVMPDYKITLLHVYGETPWWFHNKNIKMIEIGDGVTSIGDNAFHNCRNIVNATIPDGITEIGRDAFASCRSLEKITIPASVTTIGHCAFGGCSALKAVTIMATVPPTIEIGDFLVNFDAEDDTLYVPAGCAEAYEADETWRAAFTRIVEQDTQ